MSIAGPGVSFCVCGTYPSVNVSQQSAYSLGDISKTWLHYCQECLLVNLKYKEKTIDFIITVYKQHVTTVGEQYSEKYLNGIANF